MADKMGPKDGGTRGTLLPLIRPHMPELDAIRGMAILGVLLYHGLYWAHDLHLYTPWQSLFLKAMALGQYGVNLFFVLSGFLITGILIDSRDREGYYRRFYLRRALRILPAYYGTLLILAVFGLTTKGFLWMSLFYSSNLSLLVGIEMSYGVLWSLSVEEHFYLVWPAVVKRVSPKIVLRIAMTILIASPILRFLCASSLRVHESTKGGCSYYTWNCADGLALGAVVAILVRQMNNDRRQLKRLAILLAAAAILIGVVGVPFGITTKMNPVGEALQTVPLNLAFAALLGFFILVASGGRESYVTPRALTFLGEISYGLYLYHMLFLMAYDWVTQHIALTSGLSQNPWQLTWAKMITSSAAAIFFSYGSRWYFEEPFLRMKDLLERPGKSLESREKVPSLTHEPLESETDTSQIS